MFDFVQILWYTKYTSFYFLGGLLYDDNDGKIKNLV